MTAAAAAAEKQRPDPRGIQNMEHGARKMSLLEINDKCRFSCNAGFCVVHGHQRKESCASDFLLPTPSRQHHPKQWRLDDKHRSSFQSYWVGWPDCVQAQSWHSVRQHHCLCHFTRIHHKQNGKQHDKPAIMFMSTTTTRPNHHHHHHHCRRRWTPNDVSCYETPLSPCPFQLLHSCRTHTWWTP